MLLALLPILGVIILIAIIFFVVSIFLPTGSSQARKIVFSGLESSGKSLMLAKQVRSLVLRNAKWFKITGVVRPIVSNLKFTDEFSKWATEVMGVPIIYWKDIVDITRYEEADIIIDEIANYFDSRFWADLPLEVRSWCSQGAKAGIEIYATTQDFAQVDISFRRLVQPGSLFEIHKVVGSERPSKSRPPVNYIWGLCFVYKVDPRGYSEKEKVYMEHSVIPSNFFFIKKADCKIFDTQAKIQKGNPAPFRHETRYCINHTAVGGNGTCEFCKTSHV